MESFETGPVVFDDVSIVKLTWGSTLWKWGTSTGQRISKM